MITHQFAYARGTGWTCAEFPHTSTENVLVLIFAAPEYLVFQAPILELMEQYPNARIVGCSTSGEIHESQVVDSSLSVAVLEFERTELASHVAYIEGSESSLAAGEQIGEALSRDDLKAIFIISEGLHVNGSDLTNGVTSKINPDVCVSGGLAGDGTEFHKTFVISNGKIESGIAVGVGFYGEEIRIQSGSQGGWDKFGHERVITRSEGNVLYELDGKPALEIYKQYLGAKASELPASALLYPLSVRESVDDQNPIVRTILAVDEEENAMTFAGDVPEGHIAQFLYANFDRLVQGAQQSAIEAVGDLTTPVFAIGVSCVGRRLVLNERTDEELEATLEGLPIGSHMVGFYSYGEISKSEGFCHLHNQSMTLTTIQEAA